MWVGSFFVLLAGGVLRAAVWYADLCKYFGRYVK
jgi:hypothetical protein